MSSQEGPSLEKTRILQAQKLQELLQYVNTYSPFYKALLTKHQVNVDAIKTLDDLSNLPTTSKEDLQEHNNAFLCVPPTKVIEYTATSGTLGSPVTIALTENDLIRLAMNEYNSFKSAGCNATDTVQLMLTLDRQFMAGIAYYEGLRKLGAGIIRLGPGVPSLQWETILRLKPTTLVVVPSFLLKLIKYAIDNHIEPNSTSVKKAICIGENIRNTDFTYNILGKSITESWNIKLYSTYASTEMQTAFTECSQGHGGHLQPELLIVELLDENNLQVGPDMPGEVTITTLGVEGMPLLRYKTGDICKCYDAPCACGRSSLRLSPVLGRKKQMIKFKGTTLYPPVLFDILSGMEDVIDFVVEVYSNEIGMDEVLLHLLPSDNSKACDNRIKAYLQARLRVSPQVHYMSAAEIQKIQLNETSRKVIRFIDNRN